MDELDDEHDDGVGVTVGHVSSELAVIPHGGVDEPYIGASPTGVSLQHPAVQVHLHTVSLEVPSVKVGAAVPAPPCMKVPRAVIVAVDGILRILPKICLYK